MTLGLSVDQALSTTRAVRKRLDLERPVERSLIEECLSLARYAPNGSARQEWHFVVVGDPGIKAEIADLYRRALDDVKAAGVPTLQYAPDDPRAALAARTYAASEYLAANLERVPWLLVACQQRRLKEPSVRDQAGWWGSLLPAVWSFMLAARERGLGTAWTTMHLAYEEETARILGIPYERVTQGALIPVAHTIGADFTPAPRLPLETVVHWDRW